MVAGGSRPGGLPGGQRPFGDREYPQAVGAEFGEHRVAAG